MSFQQVTLAEVKKTIKDITLDKCLSSDIPTDIIKKCDSCFQALKNCVNQFILSGNSPDSLKLANISPVDKAKDPLDKTNHRPLL